ncbi:BglII/BstYI family type II restriction endonuclease [Bacillus velezensis]|uniref:BglII/BstYI family type II restriction endonuclease n=1 Tax=Bacillus TaxID=1386 RepID=UPI0004460EEE|nr:MULTISPECIES: BglII/BstYI family type II restriction endonuclease [Bacillus amyloliquefaciens group]AXY36811.1 restriction endonuclease [Bacillus velezensis]EYB35637.1 Restriction endonuclease BglII [Bacillus amyloliquefaciens EBL11]MCQ9152215.1 restriction endonuclease [Bacillus amyloliquefaciens]MEC0928174.1 BglII/BstYI family type II restriction endonuclease [Bacillus velezensis]MEC0971497.1 BglII/BstYI family type II restriction endonuclease [Bacillus velezensis]
MKLVTFNHHLGSLAIKESIIQPLLESLGATEIKIEKGCASVLRKAVERLIQLQGWSGKIKIDKSKGITITSMKDNVGLCLQTGNVGRFYADILKLQTLYLNGKAEAGMLILPTKQAANIMGDNLVNYERCVEELDLYKKIITMPILVIGIDN